MDTVLFIPYFLESHIVPTFGMARILREKYNVVYALPSKFKWLPEAHQFEYSNLESVPFGYGFEQVVRGQEGSQSLYFDSLADRRTARIARHREKKLLEIVEAVKPMYIVLDMLSSTDFILLYQYLKENNAGVAIHNPMLSTYTNPGVPRIGSSLDPSQSFKVRLENMQVRYMFGVFNILNAIKYFGNGNRQIIQKEFDKRELPAKYQLAKGNYFANFFDEIPELISAPEELEFFSGLSRKNQYYIGSLPDSRHDARPDEFPKLFQQLGDWKRDNKIRVIFCAFGSMHERADGLIRDFLLNVFSIPAGDHHLRIVCAFNDRNALLDKKNLPGHVFLFNRLPQPEILKYTDLFITHAGLGSIKESIAAGVPMLAYPFTKEWDSNGNAVKIAYHRLGLKGDIVRDTPEMITARMHSVLSTPVYKENVLRLRNRMQAKYTKQNFLTLFEQLIAKKIE